jgi:NAD(P)-dependent dehydrogenase (short-subunit alcohol dehydrogenase family)
MRFTGRPALVTGGAGGLGREVAEALAREGAPVAVADVSAEGAEAVAGSLRAAGLRAIAVPGDVADADSAQALVAGAADELGGLRVLVNAAGGSLNTPRDLPDITPADYELVVSVNLGGTFFVCQAAVQIMTAAGGGAIVNVSSIGGRSTTPVTGVPYAAAKAGVLGLTRRLAREVGPSGIRVNAVAPGLFLSGPRLEGMWERLSDAERDEVLDAIPLRRLPDLREAVDPILFLASDESSYITGAVLDVNGGRFMAG